MEQKSDLKRYQWKRNKEGDQKAGTRMVIGSFMEDVFQRFVLPHLAPGFAASLAEYQPKSPSVTRHAAILRPGDTGWIFSGVGSAEELEVEALAHPEWALAADDFESPEALVWANAADSSGEDVRER